MSDRYDRYGQTLNDISRAMAEDEDQRIFDRLRADWRRLSDTDRLLDILAIFRLIERQLISVVTPTTPGTEDWFAPREVDEIVEQSRRRLLHEIETEWRRGRLSSGDFISDLYALSVLMIGRDRYATIAERETASFLRFLSRDADVPLRLLSRGKRVTDHGFDGFFDGSVPAFRISSSKDFVGLEIKTVVSEGSLSTTVNSMLKTYGGQAGYRENNIGKAISKAEREDPEIADALSSVRPSRVATAIVVRACTTETRDYRLPTRADQLFDRIAVFNIFGQPISEGCVGVDLKALIAGSAAFNERREASYIEAMAEDGGTIADLRTLLHRR